MTVIVVVVFALQILFTHPDCKHINYNSAVSLTLQQNASQMQIHCSSSSPFSVSWLMPLIISSHMMTVI